MGGLAFTLTRLDVSLLLVFSSSSVSVYFIPVLTFRGLLPTRTGDLASLDLDLVRCCPAGRSVAAVVGVSFK